MHVFSSFVSIRPVARKQDVGTVLSQLAYLSLSSSMRNNKGKIKILGVFHGVLFNPNFAIDLLSLSPCSLPFCFKGAHLKLQTGSARLLKLLFIPQYI